MSVTLIVVIGWLYVATLAAFTEPSVVGGIMTFLLFGALPCGLILYFAGSKVRRQRRHYQEMMAERAARNDAPDETGDGNA